MKQLDDLLERISDLYFPIYVIRKKVPRQQPVRTEQNQQYAESGADERAVWRSQRACRAASH